MDKWSANAGRWNSGQFNSGQFNSGNGNSGDWNSGNRNAGLFNTKTQKICLFNKQTDLPIEEIREIKGVRVLSQNYKNNIWVPLQEMTEEEKQEVMKIPNFNAEIFKARKSILLHTKNSQQIIRIKQAVQHDFRNRTL